MKKSKEKAIWLFAGGDLQEISAKKIISFGYKLILTDMDPNCVCRKYASDFVCLNTFDIKGNLKVARYLAKKYNIKATFTSGTDCHEVVACVAKLLGLHGANPEIANICRYKFKTRKVLSNAGLLQPKFRKVKTLEEARIAANEIGFPVVLKATDNSASRGFSEINKITDLIKESFNRALRGSVAGTGFVVVEERLSPVDNEIAEQSVETLWYNGKMYWLNWVDRLFRKDCLFFKNLKTDIYNDVSWAVEIGHISPAVHSEKTRQEVENIIRKTGLSIGLGKEKGGHILKADIMLTKNGPCVIEPTLRLSGGWDSSLSTPKRGADFIGGALKMALGEKLDSNLLKKYFTYKNPKIFSSMLTIIPKNAQDCTGRRCTIATSLNREESLIKAYQKLIAHKYISQGNPVVDNRI